MADTLMQEQIAEFNEIFALFDENKDGKLSLDELGALMVTLGLNPTDQELENMLDEANADMMRRIDFGGFLSLMARKMKHTDIEEELIEAFKVFDHDGDGYITSGELMQAMSNMGERLSPHEVEEMIREADMDSDGMMSYEEFVNMIKK
eukprot:TRINITY_DN12332_c4_g1_i1.p1 TRINITY_DN12332_c4_g1~~TRINITY_DN12332_c4_g1_i1.p1  ORF type:complete len:149 (+),score=40.56 TRINITY_DN12332_c4_g1_i1:90-536(+)